MVRVIVVRQRGDKFKTWKQPLTEMISKVANSRPNVI